MNFIQNNLYVIINWIFHCKPELVYQNVLYNKYFCNNENPIHTFMHIQFSCRSKFWSIFSHLNSFYILNCTNITHIDFQSSLQYLRKLVTLRPRQEDTMAITVSVCVASTHIGDVVKFTSVFTWWLHPIIWPLNVIGLNTLRAVCCGGWAVIIQSVSIVIIIFVVSFYFWGRLLKGLVIWMRRCIPFSRSIVIEIWFYF